MTNTSSDEGKGSTKSTRTRARSAITGRFVSKSAAKLRPEITILEPVGTGQGTASGKKRSGAKKTPSGKQPTKKSTGAKKKASARKQPAKRTATAKKQTAEQRTYSSNLTLGSSRPNRPRPGGTPSTGPQS